MGRPNMGLVVLVVRDREDGGTNGTDENSPIIPTVLCRIMLLTMAQIQ